MNFNHVQTRKVIVNKICLTTVWLAVGTCSYDFISYTLSTLFVADMSASNNILHRLILEWRVNSQVMFLLLITLLTLPHLSIQQQGKPQSCYTKERCDDCIRSFGCVWCADPVSKILCSPLYWSSWLKILIKNSFDSELFGEAVSEGRRVKMSATVSTESWYQHQNCGKSFANRCRREEYYR